MRSENKLKGSLDSIVNINANEEDLKILKKLGMNSIFYLSLLKQVLKRARVLKLKLIHQKILNVPDVGIGMLQ